MRCLLTLAFALLCTSCPRQTNETVPVAQSQPTERLQLPSTQSSSAAGKKLILGHPTSSGSKEPRPGTVTIDKSKLAPPIPWLELASAMHPAPLPADVISKLSISKLSADRSQASGPEGNGTVWVQGFTSQANGEELGNYYGGLLGAKGYKKIDVGSEKNTASPKGQGPFRQQWLSSDRRFVVEVYSTDMNHTTNPNNAHTYVLEIHDRPVAQPKSPSR